MILPRSLVRNTAPLLLLVIAALAPLSPLAAQHAASGAVAARSRWPAAHDALRQASALGALTPSTDSATPFWSAPARFGTSLVGALLLGVAGGIAGGAVRGECGIACDPGHWGYVEGGITAGAITGAALGAALPRLGSRCTSLGRRIRATAVGSVVAAATAVFVSPFVVALDDSSEQPDAALWMAGVGSVLGATVSGARCRG